MKMAKTALITGASAGIGAAVARRLSRRGYRLILLARREDRLQALQSECLTLGSPEVDIAAIDISDRRACEDFFRSPRELHVLINSAGLAAGTDPMDRAKISDWESMVETNVMGLLYITRLAVDSLKATRGHVVNLGSVAGHWTYPGGGVYCATKAAVRALSEGLRLDLMGTGVRVTNIEPGMVETEFSVVRYGGDKGKADKVYSGMEPLTADDVAESIEWCLDRPARVNIQEMMIFPTDKAGVGFVNRRP